MRRKKYNKNIQNEYLFLKLVNVTKLTSVYLFTSVPRSFEIFGCSDVGISDCIN